MSHPTPPLADCDAARRAWSEIVTQWSATVDRARALPVDALYRRVNDEWSFVETLRHLVFVIDVWACRQIRSDPHPYHPLGLPPDFVGDVRSWGIDVDAEPSFDAVYRARLDRIAIVQGIVDELTPERFERGCAPNPAPGFPIESVTVSYCLAVLVHEERAHHGFAVRDLGALEQGE